jgi:hypothetical protein
MDGKRHKEILRKGALKNGITERDFMETWEYFFIMIQEESKKHPSTSEDSTP